MPGQPFLYSSTIDVDWDLLKLLSWQLNFNILWQLLKEYQIICRSIHWWWGFKPYSDVAACHKEKKLQHATLFRCFQCELLSEHPYLKAVNHLTHPPCSMKSTGSLETNSSRWILTKENDCKLQELSVIVPLLLLGELFHHKLNCVFFKLSNLAYTSSCGETTGF